MLVVLAVGLVIVAVRLISLVRYRRRRGRWGLLQDRFGALADPTADPTGDRTVATNTHIASTVGDGDAARMARAVADELDRAAFDPTWFDDDERFEQTRSALATLERSKR
jgi:hypothetical protein